jgi:hypothetical protein
MMTRNSGVHELSRSHDTDTCFHSVIICSLLFRGHSTDSIKIFRLQGKIIRVMMGCGSSDLEKIVFNLEIVPFPSQYILSVLLFMVRNNLLVNSEVYHIDIRQHANFSPTFSEFD